jgi:hypothetical protein
MSIDGGDAGSGERLRKPVTVEWFVDGDWAESEDRRIFSKE